MTGYMKDAVFSSSMVPLTSGMNDSSENRRRWFPLPSRERARVRGYTLILPSPIKGEEDIFVLRGDLVKVVGDSGASRNPAPYPCPFPP